MQQPFDRVQYTCGSTPPRATAPDFPESWHAHVFQACHAAKRDEPTDLSIRAKIAIEGAIMTLPAPTAAPAVVSGPRREPVSKRASVEVAVGDDGNLASYAGFADLLVAVWDAIDNPLVRGVVTEEQVLVYADTQERAAPKMGV
ncbi:hypothetical protein BROUX41_003875 [Berkeleyomyces rouxiae]|uniref:uncharacterized protein n=1 Tax=Berkeleyomyces rouxiae TaxID=2035830 RepID=UPI003B7FD91A